MCLAVVGCLVAEHGEGVERAGVVEVAGVPRAVGLAFTPEARRGDWLVLHGGHAVRVTTADEAAEIMVLGIQLTDRPTCGNATRRRR